MVYHVLHRLAATFSVAADQRVFIGAGAVHPVQAAGNPQTGLVEPGHFGGGQAVLDEAEELI